MLCHLWHESQAEFVAEATAEQIDDWVCIEGAHRMLESARYLKKSEGGYKIVGNDHQIIGLESRRVRCRAAAKKRWEKSNGLDAGSMRDACVTDAKPMPNDAKRCQTMHNTNTKINTNSKIRSKKEEDLKEVSKKPLALAVASAPRVQTPGCRVWEAYVAAMEQHWNTTPPRNAKTSAQAKRLAELLGVEQAIALAAYYPTRRSDYYVQAGHPFGILVQERDYAALLREMSLGLKLTKETVREIVRREEGEEYDRKCAIGLKQENPFELTEAELEQEASRRLGPAR
jgi:hypothetical protein